MQGLTFLFVFFLLVRDHQLHLNSINANHKHRGMQANCIIIVIF